MPPSAPMVESWNADRCSRATVGADTSAAVRRDRAGRRPAGDRPRRCRPRRDALRHRRLDVPGPDEVGPSRSRGNADRHGGARDAARPALATRRSTASSTSFTTTRSSARSTPSGIPGLRVVTTIHGPFNEELTDIYTARSPTRVPIICISNAQRRAAPDLEVARVIHHGLDRVGLSRRVPATETTTGSTSCFSGRMSPDKGAHRAIEVARKAGVRLLLAAKMREPWEHRYFEEYVEPFLGDQPSTWARSPTSASSSSCAGRPRFSSRSAGTSPSAW